MTRFLPEVALSNIVVCLEGRPNGLVVDPIVLARPLAAVAVSLVTRPPETAHLARCFHPQPC